MISSLSLFGGSRYVGLKRRPLFLGKHTTELAVVKNMDSFHQTATTRKLGRVSHDLSYLGFKPLNLPLDQNLKDIRNKIQDLNV